MTIFDKILKGLAFGGMVTLGVLLAIATGSSAATGNWPLAVVGGTTMICCFYVAIDQISQ